MNFDFGCQFSSRELFKRLFKLNVRSILTVFILIFQTVFGDSFRLISYNILSDDFVTQDTYSPIPPQHISWENRRGKIIKRIETLQADVVCLQELSQESFAFFQQNLKDYEGTLAQKGNNSKNGIGTFCRKDYFTKVNHHAILCEGTSKCGKMATQPALLTKLLLKEGTEITVINTKIKWSPSVSPGDAVWNHVKYIVKIVPSRSAILVGDFNMTSDHVLMKNFHDVGLVDPFAKQNLPTCYANGQFKRIDYILVTNDLQAKPLIQTAIAETGILPNENEPSDHLPIGCIITK